MILQLKVSVKCETKKYPNKYSVFSQRLTVCYDAAVFVVVVVEYGGASVETAIAGSSLPTPSPGRVLLSECREL